MAKKKFTRKNICLIGWDINMEHFYLALVLAIIITLIFGKK